MNNSEYTKYVLQTESADLDTIGDRLKPKENIRLLHASMGIVTEAGELVDALKKHIFYGKPLDTVNLIEELGDLLWYIEIAMDELDTDIHEVRRINIDKLKTRYGESFSSKRALNRDLNKEVTAMKGK